MCMYIALLQSNLGAALLSVHSGAIRDSPLLFAYTVPAGMAPCARLCASADVHIYCCPLMLTHMRSLPQNPHVLVHSAAAAVRAAAT
eukprot:16328-Heterococcus_DN1.PRE.2